jgi:hypothetical protein
LKFGAEAARWMALEPLVTTTWDYRPTFVPVVRGVQFYHSWIAILPIPFSEMGSGLVDFPAATCLDLNLAMNRSLHASCLLALRHHEHTPAGKTNILFFDACSLLDNVGAASIMAQAMTHCIG